MRPIRRSDFGGTRSAAEYTEKLIGNHRHRRDGGMSEFEQLASTGSFLRSFSD
jgi:hypothetical protein